MAANRDRLQSLPTELLLQIYECLPPTSQVTVPYICRRFYSMFHTSLDKLSKDELYEHVVLMERDGFRSKTVSCCSGCKKLHPLGLFIDRELRSSGPRSCLLSAKLVWVNPTTQFSFNELSSLKFSRQFEIISGVKVLKPSIRSRFGEAALLSSHEIFSLPRWAYASKENISTLLKGFDLPTCPHTRLSDPAVVKSYDPNATALEAPYDYNGPFLYDLADKPGKCQQPECKTMFYWSTHVSGEDPQWKSIYVHIFRGLGDLEAPLNSSWMAQMASPNLPALERVWEECHQWKDELKMVEKRRYELDAAVLNWHRGERARRRGEIRQPEEIYQPPPRKLHPFLEPVWDSSESQLQGHGSRDSKGKDKDSDSGRLDTEGSRHSRTRSVTPYLPALGQQPDIGNDELFFPLFPAAIGNMDEVYEMTRQTVRIELGLSPFQPESFARKSRRPPSPTISNTISRAIYSVLWGQPSIR